jgi:hypothetical protein
MFVPVLRPWDERDSIGRVIAPSVIYVGDLLTKPEINATNSFDRKPLHWPGMTGERETSATVPPPIRTGRISLFESAVTH